MISSDESKENQLRCQAILAIAIERQECNRSCSARRVVHARWNEKNAKSVQELGRDAKDELNQLVPLLQHRSETETTETAGQAMAHSSMATPPS